MVGGGVPVARHADADLPFSPCWAAGPWRWTSSCLVKNFLSERKKLVRPGFTLELKPYSPPPDAHCIEAVSSHAGILGIIHPIRRLLNGARPHLFSI